MKCYICRQDKDEYREFYKHDKKCKDCRRQFVSEYREKNRKRCRLSVRRAQDKQRIGAPREELLDKRCFFCASTKNLGIHHRDGNGRGKRTPNNSRNNLITLCNPCHTSFHARIAKRYDKSLHFLVEEKWELSNRAIGRELGIDKGTVKHIRLEIAKGW